MALQNVIADAELGMKGFATNVAAALLEVGRCKASMQSLRPPIVVDVSDQVAPSAQTLFENVTSYFAGTSAPLAQVLKMFGPTLGVSPASVTLADLAEYMADNSLTVESRGVAYGSAADGGSNTGDQTLVVASLDVNTDVVEDVTIETLTFECIGVPASDAQLGSAIFRVRGEGNSDRSAGDGVGTGFDEDNLAALVPGSDAYALSNASFDRTFVGDGTDKIPDWTIISGESYLGRDTDQADLAFPRGDTSQASLSITGNCKLRFYFRANAVALSRLAPYLGGIWYRGTSGASATLALRIGSLAADGTTATAAITESVVVGDSSGAFQLLTIGGNTNGDTTGDSWLENFDVDSNPYFEIEVSSFATAFHLDDAFFKAMRNIGGRFCEIISGPTPPVIGVDTHTHECTLTVNTAGKVALDSGASGSVDSITVAGVELLRSAIAFDSDLATTAQAIVDEINDHENITSPAYRATRSTAQVNIFQIVPVEGTIDITSSASTISTTDTNMSGAQVGILQDALVRHGIGYLPHATGGTWGQ